MMGFVRWLIATWGWHYNFVTRLKDTDKIKTAIIIMCLNLPSFEVKKQLTFHKVKWFKYSFCKSLVIRCFKKFRGSANILFHFPLKMGNKVKNILSPAYSLKLRNTILILSRGLIFSIKWSYSQRCLDIAQRCENWHWKWHHCFDVA